MMMNGRIPTTKIGHGKVDVKKKIESLSKTLMKKGTENLYIHNSIITNEIEGFHRNRRTSSCYQLLTFLEKPLDSVALMGYC